MKKQLADTATKMRYELLLESQPHVSHSGGVRGLRAVLKRLLRRHGLRCITARVLNDDKVKQDDDSADRASTNVQG